MENMEKLVSIVIPVYNVEHYLHKCLDSVIKQTYKNLEIIIVNDGSTDNSLSICKKYADEDSRIKLISQENKGLSGARNTGIKEVSGDYIYFIDSDDWVKEDAIEKSMNLAIEYNAECVASSCFYIREEKDEKKAEKNVIIKKYSGEDFADLMTRPNGYSCYAWSRLIRKEYIPLIHFPENYTFEDIPVMPNIICKMDTVIYTNEKLYFYRQRKGSISKSKFSFKATDEMDGYVSVVRLGLNLKNKRIIINGVLFFLTKYYYYKLRCHLHKLDVKRYKNKYKPFARWFQRLLLKKDVPCPELEEKQLEPLR